MENLKLTDFFNYQYLSEINIENRTCAIVVTKADVKENNYKSSIYVNKDGSFKKMTGLDKENHYLFLNDHTLLFNALRDETDKKHNEDGLIKTHYYKLDLNGGEAQKAFSIPGIVLDIRKITENKFIVCLLTDIDHYDAYLYNDEKLKEVAASKKKDADYEVVEEIPWWSNGSSGVSTRNRSRLFVYDKTTDKLDPLMNDPYFMVHGFDANEDFIIYAGNAYDHQLTFESGLYKIDLKSKHMETLIPQGQFISISGIHLINDKVIYLASSGKRYGLYENPYVYIFDLKTKENRLLYAYEDSFGSIVGSDCRFGGGKEIRVNEEGIFFTTTIRNASYLYKIDYDGNLSKLIEKEGSIDSFDIKDDRICMIAMYDNKLQEVYSFDLKTNKLLQITHFNEEALKDKYVASYHKLNFLSDKTDIDGFIMYPKDFDPKKQYPCILDIHGGPKAVYGEVFYHEMQFWANEGYFVCFTNPTGSDGRGNAFADIRGKYGTQDYEDIMNFLDKVIDEYPNIDISRIGVTGGSYGGFMTNWIIGHTNRFACAVTQRSISNWFSMYGTCDIGYFFATDQNDADIFTEDGQNKMWWHSPLKYCGNMVTPTLFIHSIEDYRCSIPEGMQLFTALTHKGVDTRMVMFKGENHELSRGGKPLHRQKRLEEITNWMNKYLKDAYEDTHC